ncbi:hypothetical protein KIW84_074734 [Lathyrus oleraceus]|uniref:Uncharacterized protein n=1 Tax=Pisum sativum TaxID=3888 RepID=A0A9D4VS83_PEA|nr:hypothetical protein KIW84_074734 [Pisum sativum]
MKPVRGKGIPNITIYDNPDIPYAEPLEINGLNPNFVVLSDSSESGGGSIESKDKPLSSYEGYEDGNYFTLTYIVFKEELLNHLDIYPSQLHPSVWTFTKVFQYWCEYQENVSFLILFFNFFSVSHTSRDHVYGQGMLPLHQSFMMFGVYMDIWKDLKNHFVFVTDFTYEAYSDLCKILNGRYSPEDSTSSSSKSKEMINKYWIWNHFKWDYLNHVIYDDKVTLEEVSMK